MKQIVRIVSHLRRDFRTPAPAQGLAFWLPSGRVCRQDRMKMNGAQWRSLPRPLPQTVERLSNVRAWQSITSNFRASPDMDW